MIPSKNNYQILEINKNSLILGIEIQERAHFYVYTFKIFVNY
jgi:hypothetical protein